MNTRILNSGSKAQDKGNSRNYVLYTIRHIPYFIPCSTYSILYANYCMVCRQVVAVVQTSPGQGSRGRGPWPQQWKAIQSSYPDPGEDPKSTIPQFPMV